MLVAIRVLALYSLNYRVKLLKALARPQGFENLAPAAVLPPALDREHITWLNAWLLALGVQAGASPRKNAETAQALPRNDHVARGIQPNLIRPNLCNAHVRRDVPHRPQDAVHVKDLRDVLIHAVARCHRAVGICLPTVAALCMDPKGRVPVEPVVSVAAAGHELDAATFVLQALLQVFLQVDGALHVAPRGAALLERVHEDLLAARVQAQASVQGLPDGLPGDLAVEVEVERRFRVAAARAVLQDQAVAVLLQAEAAAGLLEPVEPVLLELGHGRAGAQGGVLIEAPAVGCAYAFVLVPGEVGAVLCPRELQLLDAVNIHLCQALESIVNCPQGPLR